MLASGGSLERQSSSSVIDILEKESSTDWVLDDNCRTWSIRSPLVPSVKPPLCWTGNSTEASVARIDEDVSSSGCNTWERFSSGVKVRKAFLACDSESMVVDLSIRRRIEEGIALIVWYGSWPRISSKVAFNTGR